MANRIDSTTPSGAQLSEADDAPSMPERSTGAKVRDGGLTALAAVVDGCSTLVPFNGDEAAAVMSDGLQWATHDSSDVDSFAKRLMADPKKTMASVDPRDADWCFRHFSDEQRGAALEAFAKAGMTKKVDGQKVPGAPKPPALYEVNDKQAPATQEFIHGMNVIAARNYDDAYDRYASLSPDPDKVAPYVNLEEPGTHASLEEGMSRGIARGAGDYVVGKLHDVETSVTLSRQLRKLSVGDDLQLQVGIDGMLDGVGLGASGSVKVKRGADGYRVSPQQGLNAIVTVDKDKVSGTVAWGAEYHVSTPQEVERVNRALAQGVSRSKADQEFLDAHLSGYDLKGNVGGKLEQVIEGDLKARAGLKAESSLHVDLERRTVTLTQKFSADASGQLSGGKGLVPGTDWKSTHTLDSGLAADVTVTTKYSLPPGVSRESLEAHPGDTLAAVIKETGHAESSVKVHLQRGDGAVDVEAKAKDLDASGVLATFARDGASAAARSLADHSKATVQVDRLKTTGINLGPKLGNGVSSFSPSLKSVRTHHDAKQVASFKDALKALAS